MATYLPGVKDYVPQLETFKPDYKFLSDVLNVRQDRYDSNFKSINDLYSKVVYADMSREDNMAEREQYANQLSNGLKQVSGMDLSLGQNVNTAKALFRPFFENKSLVKDMAFTKQYKNQMQMVSRMADSNDEDYKDRYWTDGVEDLKWQMDKFKTEDANNALSQGMPKYVQNPNLYKRSFEALKESGLSIKQTTLEGDWIITTKNGTALTRQLVGYEKKENGKFDTEKPIYRNPAGEFLKETVMTDPQVIRGYMVQARNKARRFSNDPDNIQKYGSVEGAKKEWAKTVMTEQDYKDMQKLAEENNQIKIGEARINNWEAYKLQYGIIEGTSIEEVYLKSIAELELVQKTKNLTKTRIKNAKSPANDVNQLMNKAYQSYMASVMGPAMTAAAVAYSNVDSEQTFEANPFKKQQYEHAFQLNKMAIKHTYDLALEKAKNKYENPSSNLPETMFRTEADGSITTTINNDTDGDGKPDTDFWGNKDDQFDLIQHNKDAIIDGYNKGEQHEAQMISLALQDYSNSFKGYSWLGESGVTMKYTFIDEHGQKFEREEAFPTALKDLQASYDDGQALSAIYKDVDAALFNRVGTTNGGTLNWNIPQADRNPNTALQFKVLSNKILHANTILTQEFEYQNEIYNKVNEQLKEKNSNTNPEVPSILLTDGEMNLLNQGYPWREVQTLSKAGKIKETNFNSKGQPVRRPLTEDEYLGVFVNMVNLTSEQEAQLKAPGASGDEDKYPFLVSQNRFWNDTETINEPFWYYNAGSGTPGGIGIESGIMTGSGPHSGSKPGGWHFNLDKATKKAKENYRIIYDNLNTEMTSIDAGGRLGFPTVNTKARLLGQTIPEGSGQALYGEYNFIYDSEVPTEFGREQIDNLFHDIHNTPRQEIKFGLGDTRHLPWEDTQKNALAASKIVQDFFIDYKSKFGKVANKPRVQFTYIEQGEGIDGEGDMAVWKLKFPNAYANQWTEGNNPAIIQTTKDDGENDFKYNEVTIYIPKTNDNSAYSSANQMMSQTGYMVEQNKYVEGGLPDGIEFKIFKNGDGDYVQTIRQYEFKNGSIQLKGEWSDGITVPRSDLDELVAIQNQESLRVSLENNNALKEWNRIQGKKKKTK